MEKEKFYCNNCGAEVKESDNSCPKCGYSFSNSEEVNEVEKTIFGLKLAGKIIKILFYVLTAVLFFACFPGFETNGGLGLLLLMGAVICAVAAYFSPLFFFWLAFMLEDVHALRNKFIK